MPGSAWVAIAVQVKAEVDFLPQRRATTSNDEQRRATTSNMKQKHISRVETGKTNGWQVRLMRNGIKHSKFFSIQRFGDIDSALAAAVAYRDSLLSIAPPSASGSVDLSPDAGIRVETVGSYKAWVASWMDETGTRRSRKFNIRKHGNLRAKQLARKARQMGVARLHKPEPKKAPSLSDLID